MRAGERMRRKGKRSTGWLARALSVLVCLLAAGSWASAEESAKPTEPPASSPEDIARGLAQFRKMLTEDPWSNPAFLDADRGEAIWKEKRGPRKQSLETCDLGLGPGVVDGAYAELPRYFPDARRVMDVESRILWCMQRIQGFNAAKFLKSPHPASGQPVGEIGAVATWVASRSDKKSMMPRMAHPKEWEAVALGEALFNRRQGPFDFSCASCHGEKGKRIRLQSLAQLSNPVEARKVLGEWPAYRVSTAHVMTLQHRLLDCYWQMRLPPLRFGSETSVALIAYLKHVAQGAEIKAPGLKR